MILFNYYVELSERGGYQLMLELLKAELERSIGIMDAVMSSTTGLSSSSGNWSEIRYYPKQGKRS